MRKFKLFIENFLVYGLGGIISKLVPLVMLPIVTRLMPDTTYFGISDLSNTAVQFGSALAVMGMYDAMYRMFFEKEDEEYKKNVCSTALTFTLFTSLIVFVIMILAKKWIAQCFFGDRQYAYLVYITAIATLVGATNSIISAPTRMQNKRKVFLVTNTLSPLLSYSISIPLLLKGHYVIALPLASAVAGTTMEIAFGIMNYRWFEIKRFNIKILKSLLVIAIPLLPNFLIYWVFNSCDKLMVTNMLSIGAAGIYSVGSKLGHASQLIYTAFAGGWQYFAFSTMRDDDQVQSNSKIFEYLGVISFIATAMICAWSYWIYQTLFVGDYVSGYYISPYLFLAPLLQMLFQVAGNQFLVIKKTWPNMLILSSGAALNVVLNLTLIPKLGIEGAAIATLLGYVVSDIICIIVLCRMKLMLITMRFILSSVSITIYIILWRMFFNQSVIIGTAAAMLLTLELIVLYRDDLMQFVRAIRKQ